MRPPVQDHGDGGQAIAWLDRCARLGLAGGVAAMLQPWWAEGFRYGFFLTLVFAVLHIVTTHLRAPAPEESA